MDPASNDESDKQERHRRKPPVPLLGFVRPSPPGPVSPAIRAAIVSGEDLTSGRSAHRPAMPTIDWSRTWPPVEP